METYTKRAFIAGTISIPFHSTAAQAGAFAQPDFTWLDERLAERVHAGYFGGMGLMVGRAETVLHEKWFGDANAQTVKHVASAGKWIAVATIATLVDAGLLKWTDTAKLFVSELDDVKGGATLAQLLSHTAGYPDYQPDGARRDDYQTLKESVANIVGLPATAKPGEIFQYGGLAMQVAGRMAEIAANQPFNDIFLSRIAAPLGMSQSGFSPVSEEGGFSPMLGGAFYCSTSDYARFLMMVSQNGAFSGKRVLTTASLKTMEASHTSSVRITKDDFVSPARGVMRQDVYGLGEWREEVSQSGAPLLLSSPGWAGAYGWVDRRDGIWGFVLAKADVPVAVAEGYSTFLGSTIYAPMARRAVAEAEPGRTKRASVAVPGGRLYYEERGVGRPVILLHGHSMDLRMWDQQFDALSQTHRVIRYDLRGYGRSTMPVEGQEFLHVRDLLALLDALKLRTVDLVGLSLGGFVVTDCLALYPDRVRKAVMAGGDLFDVPGPNEPWTDAGIAARRDDIQKLKRDGQYAFKRKWFDGLVANAGAGRDALRAPLWTMIDEWQMWQPLHVEPRLLLGRSARTKLATTKPTTPVLLIRGDRETAGFSVTDLLPQARIKILPDCGHLSNMDRPDLFTKVVNSFLAA